MFSRHFIISLFILFTTMASLHATHNRAGEITYKRIPPFTEVIGGVTVQKYHYLITVTKYTDHGEGIADRCVDTVYFGDTERGIAPRVNGVPGPGDKGCGCGVMNGSAVGCGSVIIQSSGYVVKLNTYTITHTYPGPGTYKIRSFDRNRNQGVDNIPNSVNEPFYIESVLIITSFTGANSSPIFNFSPIDRACTGVCFEHNPGAFDPDDDSLSYEISTSRGANGLTVPQYSFPDHGPGGSYGINATTGLLSWCSPQRQGEYNLAFIVKEWRKNTSGKYQLIGYVFRDMQVIVATCPNSDPPVIQVPADTCVEAGALVEKTIWVSDRNGGFVSFEAGGGPFSATPPAASVNVSGGQTSTSVPQGYPVKMTWQTNCDHIRKQAYQATFKAQDNGIVKLVTFRTYNIKVVPSAIKTITAVPAGSSIRVSWQPPACNPARNPITSYKVYRKNICDTFIPSACETGVPPSSGFVFVGDTLAPSTVFVDDNDGDGLVVGVDYSYVVVAVYADGTENYASPSVCAKLRRDVPVILNVDVDSTSASAGAVWVRWTRPLKTTGNLDTVALPGPYQFNLIHHSSQGGSTMVFSQTKQFLYQLDTSYLHSGINTTLGSEEYVIEFVAGTLTVGTSQRAGSVFLKTIPSDRRMGLEWSARTPWENKSYDIFRKGPGASTFRMIGTTTLTSYTDADSVDNGKSYCYRVLASGEYSDPQIFKPLLNNSQEVCATAIDLIAPATPTLSLEADCPAGFVSVTWTMTDTSYPNDDVGGFRLFHKSSISGEYMQVAEGNITGKQFENLTEVSGCYAVQAVDVNGNASKLSSDICIDNCPEFELPNIFTPNADGANDVYKAVKVRQIKEINLVIVDRWGTTIYRTNDPYFNWNGVSQATKVAVSEGTYFYICDVFEPRLVGIVKRTLKGYVHVAR